jgi:hexosaminidase
MRAKSAGLLALGGSLILLGILIIEVFAASESAPSVIPIPKGYQSRSGAFSLGPETRLVVDEGARSAGELLAARLRNSTGFALKLEQGSPGKAETNCIVLHSTQSDLPQAEGYELTVSPQLISIRGATPAGVFCGTQTLLQLLPPQVYSKTPVTGCKWQVDAIAIKDEPRFKWRGLLLDSARHFFNKDEVKQGLDSMALHKLNMFQWHLTDDQGWRLEIKQHPELTKVGAWRKGIGFGLDPKASTAYGPGGRYGGFYSQADVRELAAYARERNITIVPEIEMPGHASAALSAYPELSCSGGPYNTDLDGGVFAGVYCAGNEKTFQVLQEVLTEVMELFPGKYIHIEVPKRNWEKCLKCQERIKREGLKNEQELQSYFVRRIENFINSKGRTMVGWSEIREGGLANNAVLMDWIGGAAEAAREGHDVVMTPTAFCYLDYYQSTNRAAEPRAIGGFVPLEKVYAFEPVPAELEPQHRSRIIGGQGNLWTEYIPSLQHAQYMMFPRLAALAEVVWSPPGSRDFEEFRRRLRVHEHRLDVLGVNYRKTDHLTRDSAGKR